MEDHMEDSFIDCVLMKGELEDEESKLLYNIASIVAYGKYTLNGKENLTVLQRPEFGLVASCGTLLDIFNQVTSCKYASKYRAWFWIGSQETNQ